MNNSSTMTDANTLPLPDLLLPTSRFNRRGQTLPSLEASPYAQSQIATPITVHVDFLTIFASCNTPTPTTLAYAMLDRHRDQRQAPTYGLLLQAITMLASKGHCRCAQAKVTRRRRDEAQELGFLWMMMMMLNYTVEQATQTHSSATQLNTCIIIKTEPLFAAFALNNSWPQPTAVNPIGQRLKEARQTQRIFQEQRTRMWP